MVFILFLISVFVLRGILSQQKALNPAVSRQASADLVPQFTPPEPPSQSLAPSLHNLSHSLQQLSQGTASPVRENSR